ncbi:MAG: phage portal protein [Thomasclavelia sp.]
MAKKNKNRSIATIQYHAVVLVKLVFLYNDWDTLKSYGYTRLADNPEIISAVNKIANLIGSMTIHLMENTDNGDQRIKNELSRKIDINPNPYMTRTTFISALVRILLLEGDGNAVIHPETKNGLINGLYILPPGQVSFIPDGFGYYMMYNGV